MSDIIDISSSALYVVDLVKFRQTAAGDNLRVFYETLSKDPNSLSNLDQASGFLIIDFPGCRFRFLDRTMLLFYVIMIGKELVLIIETTILK